MAGKQTGKNSIVLVGGYSLSSYFRAYQAAWATQPVDVTGFGDECANNIPGMRSASITLDGLWDSTATVGVNVGMATPAAKCVTLLPEGFTNGIPSLSMYGDQLDFGVRGTPGGAIELNTINFSSRGLGTGLDAGWALQHGTITNTTSTTAVDDPTGAPVTAACAGVIHIWTPCAADTYAIVIEHSTAAGSGYATLVTFTLNGSARGSERIAVASGTINRYRRVTATRTGSAGNTFGFSVTFWHA